MFHLSIKVSVRRGDDANVFIMYKRTADTLKCPFLQNSEQLGLEGERQFSNFVKEDGAVLRSLEPAYFLSYRSRESSALMAK